MFSKLVSRDQGFLVGLLKNIRRDFIVLWKMP
jgi:hypothetical protein